MFKKYYTLLNRFFVCMYVKSNRQVETFFTVMPKKKNIP